MVSASIPAGAATLLLIHSDYAQSQTAVTLCSLGWLGLITFLVIRGIGLTAKLQIMMTLVELTILLGISLLVLFHFSHLAPHQLTWENFSLFSFTPTSFANGAVIALFFFWGWDVSINLTEETKNSEKAPGYGVVGAIIVIIVAFTAFAAVCLVALSDDEIASSGTNIIFSVADKVLPKPWNYVAVLALILSTIGTIETSMLQFSRTMFSNSREGIFHARWAQVHLKWKTPFAATLLIASIGMVLLLLSLSSESINEVMMASINIIGIQAAYYYGLAGFACAWHFRKKSLSSPSRPVTASSRLLTLPAELLPFQTEGFTDPFSLPRS
jgi:amino acid transporter